MVNANFASQGSRRGDQLELARAAVEMGSAANPVVLDVKVVRLGKGRIAVIRVASQRKQNDMGLLSCTLRSKGTFTSRVSGGLISVK